jgi:hypothetical protein
MGKASRNKHERQGHGKGAWAEQFKNMGFIERGGDPDHMVGFLVNGEPSSISDMVSKALEQDSVSMCDIAKAMADAAGYPLLAIKVNFIDRQNGGGKVVSIYEAAYALGAVKCLEWLIRLGLEHDREGLSPFLGEMGFVLEEAANEEEERAPAMAQRVFHEHLERVGGLKALNSLRAVIDHAPNIGMPKCRKILGEAIAKARAKSEKAAIEDIVGANRQSRASARM